jgi:hypothetical protein
MKQKGCHQNRSTDILSVSSKLSPKNAGGGEPTWLKPCPVHAHTNEPALPSR